MCHFRYRQLGLVSVGLGAERPVEVRVLERQLLRALAAVWSGPSRVRVRTRTQVGVLRAFFTETPCHDARLAWSRGAVARALLQLGAYLGLAWHASLFSCAAHSRPAFRSWHTSTTITDFRRLCYCVPTSSASIPSPPLPPPPPLGMSSTAACSVTAISTLPAGHYFRLPSSCYDCVQATSSINHRVAVHRGGSQVWAGDVTIWQSAGAQTYDSTPSNQYHGYRRTSAGVNQWEVGDALTFVDSDASCAPSPPPSPAPSVPANPSPPPAPPSSPTAYFDFSSWPSVGWSAGSSPGPSASTFVPGASYAFMRTSGRRSIIYSGPGGVGYYLYAAHRGNFGDLYTLSYDGTACSTSSGAYVTFSYHMNHDDVGILRVKDATGEVRFVRMGNQGSSTAWLNGAASVYSSASFRFEYLTNMYSGYVGVTNVGVYCSQAPPLPPPPTPPLALPSPPSHTTPPAPSVVCGNHYASSCDRCPCSPNEATCTGWQGAGWCNGDCSWISGQCCPSAGCASASHPPPPPSPPPSPPSPSLTREQDSLGRCSVAGPDSVIGAPGWLAHPSGRHQLAPLGCARNAASHSLPVNCSAPGAGCISAPAAENRVQRSTYRQPIYTHQRHAIPCTASPACSVPVANSTGAVQRGILLERTTISEELISATVSGLPSAGDQAKHAAFADFNGDGCPDLFVANHGRANSLFRHNCLAGGAAGFIAITSGEVVTDVARSNMGIWGDIDGDGWVDLLVVNGGHAIAGQQLTGHYAHMEANQLYRNLGTISSDRFGKVTTGPLVTDMAATYGAAFGDFDNDGCLDVMVTNQGQENVLYKNDCNGGFTTTEHARDWVGFVSTAASWGDYDGDGFLDLFVASAFSDHSSGTRNALYHNEAGSNFLRISQGALVAHDDHTHDAAWADYDGDGLLDIAIANWPMSGAYSQGSVIFRNVDGSAGGFARIALTTGFAGSHVSWVDFDGDGWLDLLFANQKRPGLSGAPNLYRNNMDGSFTMVTTGPLVEDSYETERSTAAVWADLDQDGDVDVVLARWDGIKVYKNDGGILARGRTYQRVAISQPGMTSLLGSNLLDRTLTMQAIAWGDFNNDGFVDLYMARGRLFQSNGLAGGFNEVFDLQNAGVVPSSDTCHGGAAWGDFDNDGNIDIVLTTGGRQYTCCRSCCPVGCGSGFEPTRLFRNNGPNLGFTEFLHHEALNHMDSSQSEHAVWVDFDGDGWLDLFLAVGDYSSNKDNRLLRNHRGNDFEPVLNIGIEVELSPSYHSAWGDLDGDGWPDLYLVNQGADKLYLNNRDGTFARMTSISPISSTTSVALGDYDNDGIIDLFITCSGSPVLLRGTGNGNTESTSHAALTAVSQLSYGIMGDYDGDGWQDIFAITSKQEGASRNYLFRNIGGGFELTVGSIATDLAVSISASFGDFDGDGFLDLAVANAGPLHLYAVRPCLLGVQQPTPSSARCFRCPTISTQVGNRCVECDESVITGPLGTCSFACPAGYVREYGSSDCAACNMGTFFNASAGTCQLCAAGTFAPYTGSIRCTPCPLGASQAEPGASSCEPCSPGAFSSSTGATACAACPVAGYCSAAGATSASMAFEACASGTYNPNVGASSNASCIPCLMGKANPVPRSSDPAACKACLPGSVAGRTGATACELCRPGKYQASAEQTACQDCPPGRFCVEGTSAPVPCPGGTRKSTTLAVMTSVDDCVICPVGTFCSVGSAEPSDCAPGTFNDQPNASTCVRCAPGTYQASARSTACEDCTPGYYCAEGSAAPLPCPGGTHKDLTLITMTTVNDCVICPVGTFCSVGSVEPTDCAPGTFNNQLNASICENCAAGTFQAVARSTACEACTPGYFCAEGSAAPLPCPGGTRKDASLTVMTSVDQCIICPAGTSCSVGSAQAMPCLPGSIANQSAMETCNLCGNGKFQRDYGQTACEICVPGFYCKQGSAEPTPCPAGQFGNATGLYSAGQCAYVPIDFWAPLGSRVPEPCPASGFFCPGALRDELYRGAKPVLMPVGQSTRQEEAPAVTKAMTLDMSIDDFAAQRDALKIQLAAQYGVRPSLITLEAAAGSLQLTITIATSDGSGDSVAIDAIKQAVAAVDDAALATTIGAVTGTTITVTSQPAVTSTVRVTVPFSCPRGKWCTAGLVVDCPLGTYNPLEDQDFATACIVCPLNSNTRDTNSTSRADCVCDGGFFDANASVAIDRDLVTGLVATGATVEEAMAIALRSAALIADVIDCQICPIGSACDRGATLEALPLVAGYYRLKNTTNDVRECPDARKGCASTFGTAACESLSGCQGGVGNICGDQLSGVYCEQCERSGELVYYVKATEDRTATCAPCGDSLVGSFTVGAVVLATIVFCALLIYLVRCKMTPGMWRTFKRFNEGCTPRNKIKIVLGFYQLVTKVPGVYEVTLPPDVSAVLETLSGWASFGLQGFATTPLECMGLAGYTYRLLAYMLVPAGVIVLIIVSTSCCAKAKGERTSPDPTKGEHSRREGDHGAAFHLQDSKARAEERPPNLFEECLPTMLAWLFIVYPMVTKVAFDGFPCYSFEDGAKGYLRQDVSLQCHAPDERPVLLSLVAVLTYPIAIWFFCFALLFKASPAIISGKSTPLSRAIGFLWREYEVTAFWWELVEMLRKFLLVGVFVVVKPGSVLQIAVGTTVCAAYLMVQLQATPYKKKSDDYLAVASSFSLLMVFFCSVLYKYDALTVSDALRAKMSIEQKQDYIVDNTLLSAVLLASVLSSLACASVLVIVQIAVEVKNNANLRRLKYAETGKWVECKQLSHPQAFHLFLSHAWPAAQDRMRIVKARLLECLPSCKTFLDVDDLKSGSGTSEVDQSECILVFCTLQYFEKKNSLKELYRAVCQRRPILAMLEPDVTQEGGLNQADVQALITNRVLDKHGLRKKWDVWKEEGELLPSGFDHAPDEAEVREALFATPAVEWNRLPHFQDVTIRLIAQNGIFGGKVPPPRRLSALAIATAAAGARTALVADVKVSTTGNMNSIEMYMQGEAATGKVMLPSPLTGRQYHLFCSHFNAGSEELALEMQKSDVWETKGRKASAPLTYTTDASKLTSCDHMLVLLDERTWTSGEDTAKLVEHIHEAMRLGVHLNCVHELPSVVGPPRHACEFGLMFGDDWTPAHLLGGLTNLYKEIALALKGIEWRKPGLVAFATKIAESARPHKPIRVVPPQAYTPKTGPNPWSTNNVTARTDVTVHLSLEDCHVALINELATRHGVDPSLITLTTAPAHYARGAVATVNTARERVDNLPRAKATKDTPGDASNTAAVKGEGVVPEEEAEESQDGTKLGALDKLLGASIDLPPPAVDTFEPTMPDTAKELVFELSEKVLGIAIRDEGDSVVVGKLKVGSQAELLGVPIGGRVISINGEAAATTKTAIKQQLSRATRPTTLVVAPPVDASWRSGSSLLNFFVPAGARGATVAAGAAPGRPDLTA